MELDEGFSDEAWDENADSGCEISRGSSPGERDDGAVGVADDVAARVVDEPAPDAVDGGGDGDIDSAGATGREPAQPVFDEREAIVNDRARGPAHEIAVKVEEVAAIHGFMIDLDCGILNPDVLGADAVASAEALYNEHVSHWLDRDPVLAKAEVRDTGGGLHVLLWLDQPILCGSEEAREWDAIARGIRNALPGDPSVNGIIAMTRPVGALNTKYEPPREVRQLREGHPITRDEILAFDRRVTDHPARLWMTVFCGGERVSPCPMCRAEGSSLGVAGSWQCRCYGCGRVSAASLVYRFFSNDFLTKRMG